jgi:hypothetical protein
MNNPEQQIGSPSKASADGAGYEYPRVAGLNYRIVPAGVHRYAETATLVGRIDRFEFSLRHLSAFFTPLVRFATEKEACEVLDPQLRAWELSATLREGVGALTFEFVNSHVQQAAPPPGVIEATGAILGISFTGFAPNIALTHSFHPPPPAGFAIDDDVCVLSQLFLLAKATPVTLLYVAYCMFTYLEYSYRSLPAASDAFAISKPVLKAISNLANSRGDGAEVRKFKRGVPRLPLLPEERRWLLEILTIIIRRAGALAAGVPVGPQITLDSMPLPT